MTMRPGVLWSVCFTAACWAATAAAQQPQYETQAINKVLSENRQALNRVRFDVQSMLRGSMSLSEDDNGRRFDGYFRQYIFPQMTQYDNESLQQLPQRRQNLLKDFANARGEEARRRLVQLAYDTMTAVATGNYHPAVRFNAMLIVGELNERKSEGFGPNQTPPIPLMDALEFMLAELRKPEQIDQVRVAALIGIYRHANLEAELTKLGSGRLEKEDMQQIIDRMLEIVKQSAPPPGRTVEGHAWMQRRAIEVLGEFGKVDAGGSVAKELDDIVGNVSYPLSLRCTAARSIGKLTFTDAKNFNAATAATRLGELAVDLCQAEIDRIEDWQQEKEERELRRELAQSGGGGSGRSSAYGGEGGGVRGGDAGFFPGAFGDDTDLLQPEEDWRAVGMKRRLKYQLGSVRMALTGAVAPLSSGQPTPASGLLQRAKSGEKQPVQEIVAAVDGILGALDVGTVTLEALLPSLKAQMQPLASKLGRGNVADPANLDNPAVDEAPVGPGIDFPGGPAPSGPAPGAPTPEGPGGPAPGAPAPGIPPELGGS